MECLGWVEYDAETEARRQESTAKCEWAPALSELDVTSNDFSPSVLWRGALPLGTLSQ